MVAPQAGPREDEEVMDPVVKKARIVYTDFDDEQMDDGDISMNGQDGHTGDKKEDTEMSSDQEEEPVPLRRDTSSD